MSRRWRAVERRFVVDVALAGEILSWARGELDPDPHGMGTHGDEYELRTTYFDSPSFDVMRRLGSNGRAKYRIRRYNDEEWVFLERKLRTRALLTKRRTAVPIDMVPALSSEEGAPAPAAAWFTKRLELRQLQPVCVIGYERVARQVEGMACLSRLTVDTKIHGALFDHRQPFAHPTMPLLPGEAIVELKYQGTPPLTFKALVERFSMRPAAVSKYRAAGRALGLAAVDDVQSEIRL